MGAIGQGSIQLMLKSKLGDAVSTMRPVNMSAHGGLRGILALHVALFHFLLFSDLKLHTCGNVHMPFFFLLSGFSLSATYPNLDINTSWLALKGFYQNRLARCLPVFYLCNAVGIILTYFGHGPHKTEFVSALVNSIFAICTWKNGEGPSFNGPGWTVSTLMAFYWLFPVFNALARHAVTAPRINPYLQLVFGGLISASLFYGAFFLTMARSVSSVGSNTALAVAMVGGGAATCVGSMPSIAGGGWLDRMWWLQLALGAALFRGVYWVGDGYWTCTGWPLSRFPVFLMGCLAGQQCCVENSNGAKLLWAGKVRLEAEWARFVDRAGVVYCTLLVVASIAEYMNDYLQANNIYLRCSIMMQLLCPALQLSIMVGLTQDGGLSMIARICCSRTISFMGRISMSLYLVHMPVQSCLMIILRGPFPTYGDGSKNYCETRPVSLECYERFDKYFFLPWWGIIVSTVVSLIAAYFIERYVEAPMRNLLRMPSTQKPRAKPQPVSKPQPMETGAREQGVALKAA